MDNLSNNSRALANPMGELSTKSETEPKPKRMKGQFDLDALFDAPEITPEQSAKISVLRTAYKALAQTVIANTPMCADQRATLRQLRESFATARDSIVLEGKLTGVL